MPANYITMHQMLRNIISRLGVRDVHNLPMYDMMSWMADASKHIGSYSNLESATAKVKVVNYIGEYPLDLWAIKRIQECPKFKSNRGGFTVPIKEGTVTIEYDRFPVDEEGLPLFTDSPSVIEALTFYCGKWLALQGKLLNPQMTYERCNQQWQWYCGQARAEGHTPTIDQWDRMVNIFYRWLPDKDQFINNFVGLDVPEYLIIDGINERRLGQNYTSNAF